MKRWPFNFVAAVSLALGVLTVACWVWGAAREQAWRRQAWRCWGSPAKNYFVEMDRWHLALCEQRMVPWQLPAGYEMDCRRWLTFRLTGPRGREKAVTTVNPAMWDCRHKGIGFRLVDTPIADTTLDDASRTMLHEGVGNSLKAVEVPWLALLGLWAVAPAAWWMLRRREGSRRGRGLCVKCGYDLALHRSGVRNAGWLTGEALKARRTVPRPLAEEIMRYAQDDGIEGEASCWARPDGC